MRQFIVLDSDGEQNYKYNYESLNGAYYVSVFIDGEYQFTRPVTEDEFFTMIERADYVYKGV